MSCIEYEFEAGDNFEPRTDFEKHARFVLVSEHFYYFGRDAISIPKKQFPGLEKKRAGIPNHDSTSLT